MRTVDPDKHRARRQQILTAAAPLFAAHGFDGTTTAEICRAAGMSSGNVFHYFASKRDIFVSLLTEDGDTAALLDTAETTADPWTALVDLVDHLARPATLPLVPNLVLEAMLQAERDADLAEQLDRDGRRESAAVTTLVRRAADAGTITPPGDVGQLATWITTMIGGLYLAAATDEDYDTGRQLELLHLAIERLLPTGPVTLLVESAGDHVRP